MIDRDAVTTLLSQHVQLGEDAQLEALEKAGYRVVRAGMVPQFDDLDDVQAMLAQLGRVSGMVQHNSADTARAAVTIRQLRDLALAVLRIDPDDVDPTDG